MQTASNLDDRLAPLFTAPPAEDKPERVPIHVRAFYRRMMGMLDERGLEGRSQAAASMKALAIKEQLAPRRPERFGKRDRQALLKKMVEEGKIAQPKTRITRNVPAVVDPKAVDNLLTQLPDEAKASPDAITAAIGRMFGYIDPDAQARAAIRAHRFQANRPSQRLPAHLRRALVMATSIMVALVALFPDQAEEGAAEATERLRAQFAGA